jgi:hypothetical protein
MRDHAQRFTRHKPEISQTSGDGIGCMGVMNLFDDCCDALL